MIDSYAECGRLARQLVDKEFVRGLVSPRPAVVVRATFVLWLQIVAAWAVALYGSMWLLPFVFLVLTAAIQGMMLWTHEASHFSMFDSRKLNDLWADMFFSAPVGVPVAAYRAKHMTHHIHLGTDEDLDGYPYRMNVKGLRQLALFFAKTLSGVMGIWVAFTRFLMPEIATTNVKHVTPRWLSASITIVFNVGLLTLCISASRWYLYFLLWAYPILTVGIALNAIRTIAEHQPEDYPAFVEGNEVAMRPVVRTTVPSPLEKWMLYQANFNYHLEHHLFPQVPQHNLDLLHNHLKDRGFYEAFPCSVQRSGFARFLQLARNRRNNDFSGAVNDATFG